MKKLSVFFVSIAGHADAGARTVYSTKAYQSPVKTHCFPILRAVPSILPFQCINDPMFEKDDFGGNFYRSDDVSSVAYFYLIRPYSNLPEMKDKQLRIEGMKEKVWTRKK